MFNIIIFPQIVKVLDCGGRSRGFPRATVVVASRRSGGRRNDKRRIYVEGTELSKIANELRGIKLYQASEKKKNVRKL